MTRADKAIILPLIDDTTMRQQVRAGAAAYGRALGDGGTILRELGMDPFPWL